jgi:hypothetical protein
LDRVRYAQKIAIGFRPLEYSSPESNADVEHEGNAEQSDGCAGEGSPHD